MKTIQKYLLALLIVAMPMMWAGCSDDDTNTPNPGPNPGPADGPIVIENEGNIVIPMEGGEHVLKFSATSAWEAVPDQSWCRINPRSGEKGQNQLTITVPANNSYNERNSMVILRLKNRSFEKKFTVTQKQKGALTLTSNKVEVGSAAEEITVEVKTNEEVTFEIAADAKNWIKEAATRAIETKTYKFRIEENASFDKRQGKITFKAASGLTETFTVYQSGAKEEVILSQSQFTLDHKAQDFTVEVRSNVEHRMIMPTDANWLTKKESRSYSSSTYVFHVEANTKQEIRTAEIKFEYTAKGKTETEVLTVLQKYEGGMSQNLIIVHNNKKFTTPTLFGEQLVAKILWGDSANFEDYKAGATHTYSDNSKHTVTIEAEGAESFNMNDIEGLEELNVTAF